jgi:hypothetical protein
MVLAIGSKVREFKHGRGDKNPQHAFLSRESKAGDIISNDFTGCKNHLQV